MKNVFLSLISKHLQEIPIFDGHHRIPYTQIHGYRHQNRDSTYDRAHVMTKYVNSYISIAGILKWCHKTRLRGENN